MISDSEINSNICPECGGMIISIQAFGEVVCGQCGLVINERAIDFSHSGRRAFTNQEKTQRERTGSPISILMPNMSLSTVIERNKISNPDLKRAVKWNTRISWQTRHMLIATTELKRICSNLNLPDYIKKEAMYLYKQAFEKKLLRGRSINGVVAACIYYAIRIKKIPITFQEVIDETSTSAKDVRRYYATVIREFNLKAPNADPINLIPKNIAKLGLNNEIEKMTLSFLKTYKSNIHTSGKNPKGIVAGAIYLSCKIKELSITQSEIAKIVGVTEVTLRSRYSELIKTLNINVKYLKKRK